MNGSRARHHLGACGVGRDVTLIITGGLRTESDFVKAMAPVRRAGSDHLEAGHGGPDGVWYAGVG